VKQPPSTAEERRSRNRQPLRHGADDMRSIWRHSFRDRDPVKELEPHHWSSASRLPSQSERIATAVSEASSTYMHHPPYPKQGGGPRNFAFSHMSASYDYRQRQPSKEVAGTCPIMRTRPQTESARINEEVERTRLVDVHAGGNWTLDPKYGNPVTHSAQSIGNTFRSQTPSKWLASRDSPNATQERWRGTFVSHNPPPSASFHFEPMGTHKAGWLHHEEPFVDHFHDTVAVNTKAEIDRFVRQRSREHEVVPKRFTKDLPTTIATVSLTQSTPNRYVENPSLSCTWNIMQPPPEPPEKSYHKYLELS